MNDDDDGETRLIGVCSNAETRKKGRKKIVREIERG